MARLLIVLGLLLLAAGVALQLGFPFGRLPGDFTFRRGNTTIYLPFATSLFVSVVLSIAVLLVRR